MKMRPSWLRRLRLRLMRCSIGPESRFFCEAKAFVHQVSRYHHYMNCKSSKSIRKTALNVLTLRNGTGKTRANILENNLTELQKCDNPVDEFEAAKASNFNKEQQTAASSSQRIQ